MGVLSGAEVHTVNPYRAGNVLKALLSNVLEGEVETPGYILLNTSRDTNASGLGQTLQPSRDVHPIAENVVVDDHDIADVDAYSKFDAVGRRHIGVTLGHPGLPLGRTTQCINHTGKFD